MTTSIIQGDCREVLAGLEPDSFHAVVTDPPAGIGFMGRTWDSDKGGRRFWVAWMTQIASECLRVCKPGAHALIWSLPRTSHWTGWAWEDAGWVPRDCVYHLFGSGFPKSLDVSKAIDQAAGAEREIAGLRQRVDGKKPGHSCLGANGVYGAGVDLAGLITTVPATEAAREWQGWGTALKPAAEQWWLFRKPLSEGTVAANVLRHGTGALNVDASRVATNWDGDPTKRGWQGGNSQHAGAVDFGAGGKDRVALPNGNGRWPANLVHDGSPEVMDAFARFGERESRPGSSAGGSEDTFNGGWKLTTPADYHSDTGTAARFFFCGKADSSERVGNHPTVKPVALMEWLVRLVTPPGGRVLDCFAGTGSTLVACDRLGFDAVGIEQDAQTVADAHEKIRRMRARRMIGDAPAVPLADSRQGTLL